MTGQHRLCVQGQIEAGAQRDRTRPLQRQLPRQRPCQRRDLDLVQRQLSFYQHRIEPELPTQIDRLASFGQRRQAVAGQLVAPRGQVARIQAQGGDACDQRLLEILIQIFDTTFGYQQVLEQHRQQAAVGRLLRLGAGEAFDQVAEIVAAVLGQLQPQYRCAQACIGKSPGTVADAAPFQIDHQFVEPEHGAAPGIGQGQPVDLETQFERIETHRFDTQHMAAIGDLLFELPLDQRRQHQEAEHKVSRSYPDDRHRRHAEQDFSEAVEHGGGCGPDDCRANAGAALRAAGSGITVPITSF